MGRSFPLIRKGSCVISKKPHILYLCRFSEGEMALGLSPKLIKKKDFWRTFGGITYPSVKRPNSGKRCMTIPV